MNAKVRKSPVRPKAADKEPPKPKQRKREDEEAEKMKEPERTGPYDDPHRRPA